LLAALGELPELHLFYLAGGIALGLRLGHRRSQSLGFFANTETLTDEFRHTITARLAEKHPVQQLQDSFLGLVLQIDDQTVSLFTWATRCWLRLTLCRASRLRMSSTSA
jgi:hypothetical protein